MIDSDAELARARALVEPADGSDDPADVDRLQAQARLDHGLRGGEIAAAGFQHRRCDQYLVDRHGLTGGPRADTWAPPAASVESCGARKDWHRRWWRLRARFRVPADVLLLAPHRPDPSADQAGRRLTQSPPLPSRPRGGRVSRRRNSSGYFRDPILTEKTQANVFNVFRSLRRDPASGLATRRLADVQGSRSRCTAA